MSPQLLRDLGAIGVACSAELRTMGQEANTNGINRINGINDIRIIIFMLNAKSD